MGLASCGSIGSLIVNSLWLIAVDPHRGGAISLPPHTSAGWVPHPNVNLDRASLPLSLQTRDSARRHSQEAAVVRSHVGPPSPSLASGRAGVVVKWLYNDGDFRAALRVVAPRAQSVSPRVGGVWVREFEYEIGFTSSR